MNKNIVSGYSSFSNRPSPGTPPLDNNHRRSELEQRRRSLEFKMLEIYGKSREMHLEEHLNPIADNFIDLLEDVKQMREISDKIDQMKMVDPEEILNYVKNRPSYEEEAMNRKEEKLFIEIEKALSDPQIIPITRVSELNAMQLGVLWHAHANEKLSSRLFNHLIVIRMKNFEPETISRPGECVKFRENNGILYERTPLELCALVHERMFETSADEYKTALKNFMDRLPGIEHTILEQRLQDLNLATGPLPSASSEKPLPHLPLDFKPLVEEFPLVDNQVMIKLPSVPDRIFRQTDVVFSPRKSDGPKIKYYELTSNTIDWMHSFLPHGDAQDLLAPKASVDDVWKYGKNELFEIMQRSLSKPKMSETKREELDTKSLSKIGEISSNARQRIINSMAHPYREGYWSNCEAIEKINRIIKERNDERKKDDDKECKLVGEELVDAYFEELDKFVKQNIDERLKKSEKKRILEKLAGNSKNSKREQIKMIFNKFQEEAAELKSFAKAHPSDSIYFYKKDTPEKLDSMVPDLVKGTGMKKNPLSSKRLVVKSLEWGCETSP